MANKKKDKIIEIDLGGVKEKVDTFTSEEKISELEKIQLGNSAIKQIQASTPTYKPKNWYEQIALTAGKLWVNINNVWTQVAIGTFLSNIVEDTTPQLGGDLDLNGKNIDFPTTANISDCLDEDDMASDSATKLATQQSIKKYVDDEFAGIDVSDFYGYSASDVLQVSADTERYNGNSTPTKVKEIKVFKRGVVRAKFDAKSTTFPSYSGKAQIYINGATAGTEQTINSLLYDNWSEDIDVEVGDLVQLYVWSPDNPSTYVQNFRLYWTSTVVDSFNVITD